jgi:ADP-ribose pyrophosphatase
MEADERLFETVLSRDRVFDGVFLHCDRLTVRLPDGRSAAREVVLIRRSVAVLPVDRDGRVHLVRQHRPAIGRTIVEAPAGLADDGEDLASAAARECEEETGMRPAALRELLTYAHAEGYSTGFVTLYLGTDLEGTGRVRLDANEFVEPVVMPFAELLREVRLNRFVDSKTILAALLAAEILE